DGPAPHGLPGRLQALLVAHGARPLPVDEPRDDVLDAGVDADFFVAATPSDELREVCRRVVAEGLRWDEVEIVATDPDTYGIALDALSQRVGVGATMLRGIPLARTRLGRALDRWFDWLANGLPADVLRQALEAGELRGPDDEVASTALARELRSLRIGWGRRRYELARERLEDGARIREMKQREEETDEEFAARRASRQRSGSALAVLLGALLAATPDVPERGDRRPVRSTCAALARATLAYLEACPIHGQAESRTMERLRSRLESLGRLDEDETFFSAALAMLRESLAELRAWPLVTSERKPWSAAGGMVHLTTTSHAGVTGRARIFVVGLDAERSSGAGRQDPLIPDAVRRALGTARLMTSVERRDESSRVLLSALASLRGRVTMSYATSGSLDGRDAGPSPILLQAWRARQNDPALTYEALRTALGQPACAVPAVRLDGPNVGDFGVDRRDVWLEALAPGALLLDGADEVREAFPILARGLVARDASNADELSAYHGLVPAAGQRLDPAARLDREISPSSLEMLAKCPLSWFYRYGLSLRAPVDPAYDEARWLDALARGSLLHEVFELFTREYQGRQHELNADDARRRVLEIAEEVIVRWRVDVPPPAETVFEAERAGILQAALAFLQLERDRWTAGDRGVWTSFELKFGDGEAPGPYPLPDGRTLLTNGRADRVDEMPDGTLRVVDYKTGVPGPYTRKPKTAPFNGGRQLQPALYVAAVSAITGKDASRFEYRFPTPRGENEVVGYSRDELTRVGGIVASLLGHVGAGEFVPTNDVADCKYCDYKDVCRSSSVGRETSSPRAEWAAEHAPSLPQYATMLARRAPETA
ncbi:MAG TPA: PD-(D/E)XK nuclease family protein, partial [Gemmatimonadaceae bacterium]|nr:PD-(D/E)XK nuclease family protein [Gemmatimonadaceae bacterium]